MKAVGNPDLAARLEGSPLADLTAYCDDVRGRGMSDDVLCRLLDDLGFVYRRALLAGPETTRKYRRFLEVPPPTPPERGW